MGLVTRISQEVDRMTDESQWNFYLTGSELAELDLKVFHDVVKRRACAAAENDDFKQSSEVYWRAAKSSIVLEVSGKYENVSSPSFNLDKRIVPINDLDSDIINSGLRFNGMQVVDVGSRVQDYLRDCFEGKK